MPVQKKLPLYFNDAVPTQNASLEKNQFRVSGIYTFKGV